MRDIDIVVTYLDDSVENWRKDFSKRQRKEIGYGVQNIANRQAFGMERIRNWDTLKYFLRGIEKNLDFVRNVIIVVYDEYQIPKWINQECENLRIVYHKDFMPEDILPQFNGIAVKFYVSNIDGLSDKYLISDDDYYFINKVDRSMFFKESKTVQIDSTLPYKPFDEWYLKGSDWVFYSMLNNNFEFERHYYPENKTKYWISHLPEARDRLMEQELIKENYELFKEPFKNSRFRHKNQYTTDLFTDILRIKGDCILSNDFKNKCKYVTLKSDVDFDMYKDYSIVCFNDTEQLDNFNVTKEKLIKFLESKLPNKSKFEK